jgi:hypothetical protein
VPFDVAVSLKQAKVDMERGEGRTLTLGQVIARLLAAWAGVQHP